MQSERQPHTSTCHNSLGSLPVDLVSRKNAVSKWTLYDNDSASKLCVDLSLVAFSRPLFLCWSEKHRWPACGNASTLQPVHSEPIERSLRVASSSFQAPDMPLTVATRVLKPGWPCWLFVKGKTSQHLIKIRKRQHHVYHIQYPELPGSR